MNEHTHFYHNQAISEQILHWMRQAGAIALRHFQNVVPSIKADNTLVTPADLEIEQFLTAHISTQFPDHGILSEEGTNHQPAPSSAYLWTLDPIDGTTAFARGLPNWGIALALLCEGTPVWGAFYMPLLDDLTYSTAQGVQCTQHSAPLRVCTHWEQGAFIATSMSAHTKFHFDIRRLCATGSISANLMYTARGTATAAFIPRAYLWDLAVGAAILPHCGGEMRYLSGKKINYLALLDGQHAPEAVLAGDPYVVQQLQHAIHAYPFDPEENPYAKN